ncbi:hypothetical protein [Lactococcus petauri]|uniref:hypothetical protein n=1 Tax=Lactococcus petauri TaxID=1940789 RepID=UPI0018A8B308|nr:hypothetical protein [Lactococcus petauri]MDC0826612.1 hypothetical protein [Lactococcus petauri]
MLFEKLLNFSHERKVALVRKQILGKFAIRQVVYFDDRVLFEVGELKASVDYRGRTLYGRDFIVLATFDSEEKAANYLRKLRNEQPVYSNFLGVLSDE